MKCFASLVLLGLLASAHASYLQVGKEYVYTYSSSVVAGSEDYVNFASSFNITGKARIQKTSATLLKVKLDDIKFGAYNGEFNYFPQPSVDSKAYQELNPLTEPFHVQLDSNNLVTGVVLSQSVPEWARNIQRGLAGTLQVNQKKGEGSNYQTEEKTVNGDCPVVNQIVVSNAEKKELQLRKYTSHQDCQNRAIVVRQPGFNPLYCPDANSRDVYNSSYWAVYDVTSKDGEPTITKVQSGGSVLYQLFGSKGHQQYSFVWTTFELDEVKSSGFSQIGNPSSEKTYNSLKYVFEYEPDEDEEPSEAHPFFFHYKDAIKDDASLNKVADVIIDGIKKLADSFVSTKVFTDLIQFHKASPFQILPVLSALNYNQLQTVHNKVKAEAGGKKTIELQIFYDALVASGSSPAALLARDIITEIKDITVVSRLVAKLPAYLRNPNEKLLKELEVLIKPDLGKHEGRMITFSFASLISRVCEKSKCVKSGFLDKYIKIFSDQFDNAKTFEDKTVAVTALRNIRLGGALDKLYSIAVNKAEERSVRVQAIVGLKYLAPTQPEKVKEALLPIFYDRQAHPELRNTAGIIYLMYTFDEKNVQQMVFSMYTEQCKFVKNFLYTFLKGVAYSTRPCISRRAHVAKTVLTFFPAWKIDRTLSGNYIKDYHDPEYNFGQLSHYSIQRTGSSILPLSLYASLNGAFAGYAEGYLSVFVRLEGLGDSLASRIMSMTTGQIDFSEVKEIFGKIGVKERENTPLRIELGVYLHNRAVFYHAADATTVTTIPMIIKKLQELKKSFEYDASRLLLLGGVTIEQPSALGTPISTISSLAAFVGFNAKIERDQGPTSITSKQDMKFHSHLFGYSAVSNHLPAFGSMHSVVAVRTLRIRLPRQVTMGFDWKNYAFNFDISTPTEENPAIAMTHATSFTNVKSDQGPHKDQTVHSLLKGSCPNCQIFTQISKGAEHRKGRRIGIAPIEKFMSGIKRGAEYFDCERPHSRYHTIKQVAKYFNEQNKNYETFRLGRFILGFQYMADSLFLSPKTQTCGLKAYFYRDPNAKTIWEKVEGTIRAKYTPDPDKKIGTKLMLKGILNFNYIGSEPNTRSVDFIGNFQFTGIEKRQSKLRFLAKDVKTGKSGVLCAEINSQAKKAEDFLDYEGPNEPEFERTMKFQWGLDTAGAKDAATATCPPTFANIKLERKAHRSQDQIEEAKAGGWPYKQCAAQKGSPDWPGTKTPSTPECIQAAVEQTNLRESNITIEYKLDAEARNRWKKPLALLGAFLVPYWEEDGASTHAHTAHGSGEPGFVEGKLEVDVSLRKENPTLDVHWHGSAGREEHFHNIDLDIFPGPLKVQPVFSRFQPFYYNAMKSGIFAYCVNSPKTVITFDNTTYNTDLSECPTLLAGDCDDKPRFAVLSRKIAADKVAVSIHVGDHKIEFKDLNTAIVDDKEVPITDSVYTDEEEEKLYKFVKFNPTFVIFASDKLGIFVGYTGNYAQVTVGSRYRGSACGLCGNFDGNSYNDFTGPDNVCKVTPAKMAEAYTVREGSCGSKGSPCP